MSPKEFQDKLKAASAQIEPIIVNLSRMAGKIAVDRFQQNFYKGGFVNDGLHKWDAPKRLDANGKYAAQKYGTLLSASNELMNSITFTVLAPGIVQVSSDKPYARIHNKGGKIDHDIPVTPKMRKFFWAKHYEETNGDKKADSKWKGMALTKKTAFRIKGTMPQRQFMGKSHDLNQDITKLIETELKKLFK